MMQLFHLFWSFHILRDIVNETNHYTIIRTSECELPKAGNWFMFTVAKFKAWLAIWLYMGMKRQPNMKSYWMKEGFFIFIVPLYQKSCLGTAL
jgi:hypothetical protein